MPTSIQIEGLVRAVMGIVAGIAMTYGVFDQTTWIAITGGVVALVTGLWSIYSNTTNKMLTEVAKDPDVHEIVTEQAIANAIPSAKVVPHDPTRDL